MNERYVLRVRGVLGPLLRITLREMKCRTVPYQTTIRGRLSDDTLAKLLTRLDDCGIEVVHLERYK
jgi:hypothetical protein